MTDARETQAAHTISRRRALAHLARAGLALGLPAALTACGKTRNRAHDLGTTDAAARSTPTRTARLDPDWARPPGASRAASPASAHSVIVGERAWSFQGDPGRLIETPRFNLYTTLSRSSLLDRLPLFLELSLTRYTNHFTDLPEPADRLECYVMGTRGQWARLTRRLAGPAAETYLKIARGGFAANRRGVYFDIGADDTLALAAHEGWHQYTQATFRNTLPSWLEEGLGVYCEGYRWNPDDPTPLFLPWLNRERHRQLRTALSAKALMPLPELLDTRPQELIADSAQSTLNWYAQVWALVHFLTEGEGGVHKPALGRMLLTASNGTFYKHVAERQGAEAARQTAQRRTGAAALLAFTTNRSIVELNDAYLRFCVDIVQPNTNPRIDAGHSPLV